MGPPGPLLDPEGSLLAVVSGDSRVKIFNAASQRLLTEFAPGLASGSGQATAGEIVTSIAWAGKVREWRGEGMVVAACCDSRPFLARFCSAHEGVPRAAPPLAGAGARRG